MHVRVNGKLNIVCEALCLTPVLKGHEPLY
jgi:hypothetical protein